MDPKDLPIKECKMCGQAWKDREEFLKDKNLVLDGYQAILDNLDYGLFFFTHKIPGCGSTLALEAIHFLDLNKGVRHKERKTGTENCPQYCFKKDELRVCSEECECAYIRNTLEVIQEYKNKEGESS